MKIKKVKLKKEKEFKTCIWYSRFKIRTQYKITFSNKSVSFLIKDHLTYIKN